MEQTLVLVKPGAVQRGLIGAIITRFEKKGLKISALKLMQVSKELASKHYGEHVGKPFYDGLVDFITSGPIVAIVLEGDNAVNLVRSMMGKTNPYESAPGTIRGDFGMSIGKNIVHGSDSLKSAEHEIALFFTEDEILKYKKIDETWLYE
jgi:nucleoside-diphosphate kinase